jgi:outer membrane protein insertion porin family
MGPLLALCLLLSSAAERPLAAVVLEVPAADHERLARYLGIEAGQVLDREAVRAAVERLYATGEFSDVVVERRDGPSGPELLFRPVTAPRLAQVRVEGDPVLSAGAARHASRLIAGEPLWRERLDAAAQAAAVALVARGFLEARVNVTTRGQGAATDVVFNIESGRLVRVGRIEVSGPLASEETLLRQLARPRRGAAFVRAAALKAVEKMRRQLVEHDHWRAHVELHESYDPGSAQVALAFEVDPGPTLHVEFRGASVAAGLRRGIESLLRSSGVTPDALDEGAERLEDEFRRCGHRDVAVTTRREVAAEDEAILYQISEGPVANVASASITGLPEGLSLVSNLAVGLPLDERRVRAETERLTRALEADGYAEAQVEAELRDGGGSVPVVWLAQPGPRVLVSAFDVVAPEVLPREAGSRELRTRIGRPYRVSDLALDRNALLASWRNAGYPQVAIEPDVVFSEDRSEASVTLRVEPGARIDVDTIIVAGLTRTQESVVRRELLVREGQPLGLANLLESQRRLGALGLFRRLSITELPGASADRRNLVVSVEEGPATTFAYGLGYAENDLLRGSVEVTRRNLGGMDRTLSAFLRASFRTTRMFLSYREPYLFGRRHELFVTAFREEEARPGFDFTRGGGLLQTGFALSRRTTLILRYSYEKTDTFNVTVPESEVDREFQDATFSGPSASILDDTRDDALDPHRGHFLGADLRLSSAALGGDSFVKASLQAATYRRATARALLALSARVGVARAFGFEAPTRLPLPERFFAGGDFSLRGFPIDGVDEAGGNGLLLGSAELRYDVSRSVSLAAFTDAGNVYPFAADLDLGNIRASAGLGVRYKTALGPVRVDWAFKLDRRTGESASRLHVAVGHAF